MQQVSKLIIIFLCLTTLSTSVDATPWYTGPIIAPAGHTVPRGHTNLEIYGIDIFTNGRYSPTGQVTSIPLFRNFITTPIITHGFTDWFDVQFNLPYVFNNTQHRDHNRLGDVSLALGFQLIEQKDSWWRPNLRLVVQEIFPTGKYELLNPLLLGTDATGVGSYQTLIGFNFQQLTEVFENHYLRTRLSLSRIFPGPVTASGLSSFGGTARTQGRIRPGIKSNAVLAFEFNVTQNWVAVMEGYISQGIATRFTDDAFGGIDILTDNVASGKYYEQAIDPAIEYNFNENIGIIGGVWFPIKGENTSHYITYVLALNAYW